MSRGFLVSRGLLLTLVAVCGCGAMAVPAEAGFRQQFQQIRKKVKQRVKNSGTKFRFNYSPPKVPVTVSCDPQRNMYVTVSPRLSTPAGSFGVSGTRRVRSRRCGSKR
jgi:hypothetical protein